MDLVFIGFIQVMFILVNGLMDRVMGVVFILVKMGVDMLESLNGVLNMDLVIIISEMETYMLVNTLRTRCMDLGYIVLQIAIDMKEPGMREEGKDLECIHLEIVKPNPVTGKMESLTFQAHRTLLTRFLLLVSIIPKYLMPCRKQDEPQRKPMMSAR